MVEVEKIAEAVLYEGYLLYPYRRSSMKNQQRWTFGGVYPREYSAARGGDDPSSMLTECLVDGDEATTITVTLRFLHLADRRLLAREGELLHPVEELRVGEIVYRPWEEAIERTIEVLGGNGVTAPRLGEILTHEHTSAIAIPAGSAHEPLTNTAGEAGGALVRSWQALAGTVTVSAAPLEGAGYRIGVYIANTTPWPAPGEARDARQRQAALRQTFIATHTILRVQGGAFISLLEPPAAYRRAAEHCRNVGTWPVLVGEQGERHTMLSSPIILYDYPQIAPESPGNLFDATEIDELLTLSILTMTDEEKQEVREGDAHGRAILERTEALTPGQIMRMHGAIRGLQTIRPEDRP